MTPDALLPVAFMAGLFGGGHCLGMCGPVVVLLETHAGRASWTRRLLYNVGRGGFYALLGAIAGAAGLVLTQVAGVGTGLSLLRWVAALLVIALGVNLLFDVRALGFLERGGAWLWQRLRPLTRYLLPATTPLKSLGAGFVWGALPCGLVYSAVALAATTGSAGAGAVLMTVFWAGTLPSLLLAGGFAGRVGGWSRRRELRRLAGGLMMAVGAIALAMPFMKMMH